MSWFERTFAAVAPSEGGRELRILMYSHDTYGLGHLRRSRAIANTLMSAHPHASIVIVSGSPVIGSFDFAHGVDYVRVPGVVKLPDGTYNTHNLNMSLDQAVDMRKGIILESCRILEPDIVIVDKEPTGFRGELLPALALASARGARIILGVRDVLDAPEALVPEWSRKGAAAALAEYYDDIWVYGLREFYEPLDALPLPASLRQRIVYTGYLRRELPPRQPLTRYPRLTRRPFLLVTAGGGGDGHEMIDWVLSAYERDRNLPYAALIVFGPFMPRERRALFLERIARLPDVEALTFDSGLEHLMNDAAAVVSMGGYNTFCEILSFDKRALILPRSSPRMEQLIRTERAGNLGLLRYLEAARPDDGASHDAEAMAAAIRALPDQPLPSTCLLPDMLGGLDRIAALSNELAASPVAETRRRSAEGSAE